MTTDAEKIAHYAARVRALEDLLVCYRLGKRPSEALHRRLAETRRYVDHNGVWGVAEDMAEAALLDQERRRSELADRDAAEIDACEQTYAELEAQYLWVAGIAERLLDVIAGLAVFGLGDGRADALFQEAVRLKREFEGLGVEDSDG